MITHFADWVISETEVFKTLKPPVERVVSEWFNAE
jgi:hypothetical protein